VSDRASPDTLGLWEATAGLPEQLTDTLETAGQAFPAGVLPEPASVRAVALVGLGPAAAAGQAVAALTATELGVPLWVGPGPDVPAFVGPGTLVCVVSTSGATPETLDAAREAVARRAPTVAIGGDRASALARLAADAGVPWCPTVPPVPAARLGLGSATVAVLVALARGDLLPDPAAAIRTAAGMLARRRDALVPPGGAAAELARRIGRTFPLVYGSDGIGAVAAAWWKSEVNRNAKAPAFWASLSGAMHGELAGWGQGGDVTRQVLSLVLLRHDGEDERTSARFDAVVAATDEVMADVIEVRAAGEDDLTRLFDLVLLGELVSLHLAAHEGVDPGPVPALDDALRGPGRS
jgi:glucose/mannose-6-phosphate isomerase